MATEFIQKVLDETMGQERSVSWFRKKIREFGVPTSAKLVREGVYVAPIKSTTRKDGPTKKELLRVLEVNIGDNIDVSNFMGATKQGIQFLVNTLR